MVKSLPINLSIQVLENQQRFIPAEHQLALLLDLLLERGAEPHFLLRKTGIFYQDILGGELKISPKQLARLCLNISLQSNDRDISFVFGQRLFPGVFEQYSHLLTHAPNLRSLLGVLCRHFTDYFPLLKPRLVDCREQTHLLFEDPFGESLRPNQQPEQLAYRRWIQEALVSAIVSLCEWRAAAPLPWQIQFDYPAPSWRAEYQVHLGDQVKFSQTYSALSIAQQYLDKPWQQHSAIIYQLAHSKVNLSQHDSLLSIIRELLRQNISQLPSLEQIAQQLALSPATLKRRLKSHHSSYRLLCDEVRQQHAFFLQAQYNYSDNELSTAMNFFDVSNFRRAFRRWLSQ